MDDGSSDDSPSLATSFAAANRWARVLHRALRAPERDRLVGAGELHAFQWAADELSEDWDVIAKLDADITFNPVLVETIEQSFLADAALGIAGGYLSVMGADNVIVRERCSAHHVRGATKFYRRACYEAISPVPRISAGTTSTRSPHA